jgi:hypothetical protein
VRATSRARGARSPRAAARAGAAPYLRRHTYERRCAQAPDEIDPVDLDRERLPGNTDVAFRNLASRRDGRPLASREGGKLDAREALNTAGSAASGGATFGKVERGLFVGEKESAMERAHREKLEQRLAEKDEARRAKAKAQSDEKAADKLLKKKLASDRAERKRVARAKEQESADEQKRRAKVLPRHRVALISRLLNMLLAQEARKRKAEVSDRVGKVIEERARDTDWKVVCGLRYLVMMRVCKVAERAKLDLPRGPAEDDEEEEDEDDAGEEEAIAEEIALRPANAGFGPTGGVGSGEKVLLLSQFYPLVFCSFFFLSPLSYPCYRSFSILSLSVSFSLSLILSHSSSRALSRAFILSHYFSLSLSLALQHTRTHWRSLSSGGGRAETAGCARKAQGVHPDKVLSHWHHPRQADQRRQKQLARLAEEQTALAADAQRALDTQAVEEARLQRVAALNAATKADVHIGETAARTADQAGTPSRATPFSPSVTPPSAELREAAEDSACVVGEAAARSLEEGLQGDAGSTTATRPPGGAGSVAEPAEVCAALWQSAHPSVSQAPADLAAMQTARAESRRARERARLREEEGAVIAAALAESKAMRAKQQAAAPPPDKQLEARTPVALCLRPPLNTRITHQRFNCFSRMLPQDHTRGPHPDNDTSGL